MADQVTSVPLPITGDSATASASVTNKPTPAAGKRKAMKQRSKVWDHFTKFVNEHGKIKGKCNYCASVLACDPRSNGTTALNNHFANVCKQKPSEELKQSHLNFNAEGDKFNLVNWKFDPDGIRKALASMVIVDELPYKFVEGVGFKNFMLHAQPKFKIPSRWTIARDCFSFYIDKKMRFKDYLEQKKQRVCLTTDTWTSIQRINYMCITAHFIDDTWSMKKRVLNFI